MEIPEDTRENQAKRRKGCPITDSPLIKPYLSLPHRYEHILASSLKAKNRHPRQEDGHDPTDGIDQLLS